MPSPYSEIHPSPRDMEALDKIRESIDIQVPVIVKGPIGCGKTHLIQKIATEYDATLTVLGISGDPGDLRLLLGTFITGPNNTFIWKRGLLTLSVEEGHWVLLKDISRQSATEIIAMISSLFQERILVIPNRSERIAAHPSFRLFITQTEDQILYPGLNCVVSLPSRTASEAITIMAGMLLSFLADGKYTPGQCTQIAEFIYVAASLHTERPLSMSNLIKAVNRLLPYLEGGNVQEGPGISLQLRHTIFEVTIDLFTRSIAQYEERLILQASIARTLGLSRENDPNSPILQIELDPNGTNYPFNGIRMDFNGKNGVAMMGQTKMLLGVLHRGISNNEPMLLVGPTGTGKTTMIQYLSETMRPPGGLLVVNLHAQTEHSDLFGSWSQQSSTIEIMRRAMEEFENLFHAFGYKKEANNAIFSKLEKWISCSHVDIKSIASFWAQIAAIGKVIFSKAEREAPSPISTTAFYGENTTPISAEVCDRLSELIAMAHRFSKSPSMATFAFAEGVVLRALKRGAWLLLDEINLAPPSLLLLLESLVANYPVRVLERGDEQPVFRHPSFRLFACMNGMLSEATRRSLPESLRLKFTEVAVDPIERFPHDVELLVESRLAGSRSLFVSFPHSDFIAPLVSLYYLIHKALTTNHELCGPEVPSWTIRSLCRLIDAWQQFMLPPQSGSAIWALRQATMVVIGGQLDSSSIKFLNASILPQCVNSYGNALFSRTFTPCHPHAMGYTSKMVSIVGKNDGDYSLFLPVGPLELKKANENGDIPFIETEVAHRCMLSITRVIVASIRHPWALMLVGPTSAGKTTAIAELARRTGHRLIRINNHEHTDVSEYLGAWGFSHEDKEAKLAIMTSQSVDGSHSFSNANPLSCQTGSNSTMASKMENPSAVSGDQMRIRFTYGALVRAMINGSWLLLDELNLAPTEVLESLNRLLDDNRELYIPETGETIRPHQSFRLFATLNPHGRGYGGRHMLSEAFKSRWIILQVEEDPAIDDIIRGRCGGSQSSWLAPTISARMASVFVDIRKRKQAGSIFDGASLITLRDMFRWAFRIKQLSDVVDGFEGAWSIAVQAGWSLLGERLRTEEERYALRDLFREHFPMALPPSTGGDDDKNSHWIFPNYGRWPGVPTLGSTFHGMVWTEHFQRVGALSLAALKNKEPLLLVGETGTGKTSIAQWLAESQGISLHTIACHQYTDVSDFLGMQRPCALSSDTFDEHDDDGGGGGKRHRGDMPSPSVWKWVDGPLITAMREGHVLLIDEISLAEDTVLERLNSVLENDNRILTVVENCGAGSAEPMLIKAHPNFALIATMNPSGDFGKRELSPALRNRFTEVWVPSPSSSAEVLLLLRGICSEQEIRDHGKGVKCDGLCSTSVQKMIPECMVAFSSWFLSSLNRNDGQFAQFADDESLVATFSGFVTSAATISIRDLKTWIEFIKVTARPLCSLGEKSPTSFCKLSLGEAYCQGAEMIFLDGLAMLATSGGMAPLATCTENISSFRAAACMLLARHGALLSPNEEIPLRPKAISMLEEHSVWGIAPFYLMIHPKKNAMALKKSKLIIENPSGDFSLSAPTVMENAHRVLRAMQLAHRPILLEGDPGVGKTSLITAMARGTGNEPLIRINLSEQTDLSDLFGVDVPSGSLFSWRDGPLLAAIKAGNWILLDEINLAPQPVLEGLNSILDHRGTIYVAELNRSWKVDSTFVRIFATQNSRREGGGRKGLPQSFLNRFTRVYLEPLSEADLIIIANKEKTENPAIITRAVRTAMHLNATFAPKFDFNLRDISRLLSLNPINELILQRGEELIFGSRFEKMPVINAGAGQKGSGTAADIDYRSFLSVRHALSLPFISRWPLQNVTGDAIEIALTYRWLVLLRSPDPSAFPMSLSEIVRHFAQMKGMVLHYIPLTALSETGDFLGGFEQQPGQDQVIEFHWKNGVLLDALEKGHWIFFENASACPASVLDRLNGLFEPNGSLFVHEKSGFDYPLVPHANFRAFMATTSSDISSISRPMRNRALEIYLRNSSSSASSMSIVDTIRFLWNGERAKFSSDLEFYNFAKWIHHHALTSENNATLSEYFARLSLQLRKICHSKDNSVKKALDPLLMDKVPHSSLVVMHSLSMSISSIEFSSNPCLFLQRFVKHIFDGQLALCPIQFEFQLVVEALATLYAAGNEFPSEHDVSFQKLSFLSSTLDHCPPIAKQDESAILCRLMVLKKLKSIKNDPHHGLDAFFSLIVNGGGFSELTTYFSLWQRWFSNPIFLIRSTRSLRNFPLPCPEDVFSKEKCPEKRKILSTTALLELYSIHNPKDSDPSSSTLGLPSTSIFDAGNPIIESLGRFYGMVALHAIICKHTEVLGSMLTIGFLPRSILHEMQYYLWSLVPASQNSLHSAFQPSWVSFMINSLVKIFKFLSGDISLSILEAAFVVYSMSGPSFGLVDLAHLSPTSASLIQFNEFFCSPEFASLLKQLDHSPTNPGIICEILTIPSESSDSHIVKMISLMLSEISFPRVDPILFPIFSPIFTEQNHLSASIDLLLLKTLQLLSGSLDDTKNFDEHIEKVVTASMGLSESIETIIKNWMPVVFNMSSPSLLGILSQLSIFKGELLAKLSFFEGHSVGVGAIIDGPLFNRFILSLLGQLESEHIPSDVLGPILLPPVLLLILKLAKAKNSFTNDKSNTILEMTSSSSLLASRSLSSSPSCLSFANSFSPVIGGFYVDWITSYIGVSESNLNILYSFLYTYHPCRNRLIMKGVADAHLPRDLQVLMKAKNSPFVLKYKTIYSMLVHLSKEVVSLSVDLSKKIEQIGISEDSILADFNLSISSLMRFAIDIGGGIFNETSLSHQYECIDILSSTIMTCIEKGYEVIKFNDKTELSSWLLGRLDTLSRSLIDLRKEQINLISSILLQEDALYFSQSLISFSLDQFATIFRESLKPTVDFENLFKLIDSFVVNTSIIEVQIRTSLLFALFYFHERNDGILGSDKTILLNLLWHTSSYFNECYLRKIVNHISKEVSLLLQDFKEKSVLISCSYLNEMIVRQCSDKIHNLTSKTLKKLNELFDTPTIAFISTCGVASKQHDRPTFNTICSKLLAVNESLRVFPKAADLFSVETNKLSLILKTCLAFESVLPDLLELSISSGTSCSFLRNQKLKLFSGFIKECRYLGLLNCVPKEIQSEVFSPLSSNFSSSFLHYPVLSMSFNINGDHRFIGENPLQKGLNDLILNVETNFVGIFEVIPKFKKFVISIPGLSTPDQTFKIHKIVGNLVEWLCINSIFANVKVSRFYLLTSKLVYNWSSACEVKHRLTNVSDVCAILSLVELTSETTNFSIENMPNVISSLKNELCDIQVRAKFFASKKNFVSNEFMKHFRLLLAKILLYVSKYPFLTSLNITPSYDNDGGMPVPSSNDPSYLPKFANKIMLLVQHLIGIVNRHFPFFSTATESFEMIENAIPRLYAFFKALFSDAFYGSLSEFLVIVPNCTTLSFVEMLASMVNILVYIFVGAVNSISESSIYMISSITNIYENAFGEVSMRQLLTSPQTNTENENIANEQQSQMSVNDGGDFPKGLADSSEVQSKESKNVSNEIEYEEQVSDVRKQNNEKFDEKDNKENENDVPAEARNGAAVSTTEKMDGMQDSSLESEFEKQEISDQNDISDENTDELDPHTQEDYISEHQFNNESNEENDDGIGTAADEILEKLNNDSFPQHLDKSIWQDNLSSDRELSEVSEEEDHHSRENIYNPSDKPDDTIHENGIKQHTADKSLDLLVSENNQHTESSFENAVSSDQNTSGIDDTTCEEFQENSQSNDCRSMNEASIDEPNDSPQEDIENTTNEIDGELAIDVVEDSGPQPLKEPYEEEVANDSISNFFPDASNEEKQSYVDNIHTDNMIPKDTDGNNSGDTDQNQQGNDSSGKVGDVSKDATNTNIIEKLLELPPKDLPSPQQNDPNTKRLPGDQLTAWRNLLMSLETSDSSLSSKDTSELSQVFEYDVDPLTSGSLTEQVLSQTFKKDTDNQSFHSSNAKDSMQQEQNDTALPIEEPFDRISLNESSECDVETEGKHVKNIEGPISNSSADLLQEDKMEIADGQSSDMVLFPNERTQTWSEYLHSTHGLACDLTEKLRMILEPTIAGKLQGDYKTGKRLNMKKVILYIASGYRKDKIWLRRTKPSKRNYQILISVDQSLSMESSGAPHLLFQIIALLSQVFSKIEAGHVGLAGFGASTHLYIPLPGGHSDGLFSAEFNEQAGEQILKNFQFNAESTNLLSLLSQSLEWFKVAKDASSFSACSQIHFVLTDGIFSNSEKVRKLLDQFSSERILVIFLLLDARPLKDSILELKSVSYEFDGVKPVMKIVKYIDQFPAEHYLVIRDISTLPSIFCKCLKEWIEGINRTSVLEAFHH